MSPGTRVAHFTPGRISREYIQLASRWIWRGMSALAVGTCLEIDMIARVIMRHSLVRARLAKAFEAS